MRFGWEAGTVDKRRGSTASAGFRDGSRALRHTPYQLETAVLRTEENGRLLLEAAHRRRHSPRKLPLGDIRANVFYVSLEKQSSLQPTQKPFPLLPLQPSA